MHIVDLRLFGCRGCIGGRLKMGVAFWRERYIHERTRLMITETGVEAGGIQKL